MLARVGRLEAARSPVLCPFETEFGSLNAFEAHCRAGVSRATYDAIDIHVVMLSIRRWQTDRVWMR